MDKKEFYRIYLPALKKAFDNETESSIKDPELYIEDPILANSVMWYIEKSEGDSFLDSVAYYYDARAHEFPDIQGVDIKEYRERIVKYIPILEKLYKINENSTEKDFIDEF